MRIAAVRFAVCLGAALLGSCSSGRHGSNHDPMETSIRPDERVYASVLAAAMQQSRENALAEGVRPVPRKLERHLRPVFGAELLSEVRWNIVSDRWSLDTLIAQTRPQFDAVTLGDVIVFADEASSRNLQVWIHELLHVQQMREAGLEGFAQEYVSEWSLIEERTATQAKVLFDRITARKGPRRASMQVQTAHSVGAPSGT